MIAVRRVKLGRCTEEKEPGRRPLLSPFDRSPVRRAGGMKVQMLLPVNCSECGGKPMSEFCDECFYRHKDAILRLKESYGEEAERMVLVLEAGPHSRCLPL